MFNVSTNSIHQTELISDVLVVYALKSAVPINAGSDQSMERNAIMPKANRNTTMGKQKIKNGEKNINTDGRHHYVQLTLKCKLISQSPLCTEQASSDQDATPVCEPYRSKYDCIVQSPHNSLAKITSPNSCKTWRQSLFNHTAHKYTREAPLCLKQKYCRRAALVNLYFCRCAT